VSRRYAAAAARCLAQPTEQELEAAKEELVQEMVDKIMEVCDSTAPPPPLRFCKAVATMCFSVHVLVCRIRNVKHVQTYYMQQLHWPV
jgi:hypothetical protein